MWSMTIKLQDTPKCPVCAEDLRGDATVIHDSVAWCAECAHVRPWNYGPYKNCAHNRRLIRFWTVANGICWWRGGRESNEKHANLMDMLSKHPVDLLN